MAVKRGKEDSKERDVGYEHQHNRPSPEESLCYVGALIREVRNAHHYERMTLPPSLSPFRKEIQFSRGASVMAMSLLR